MNDIHSVLKRKGCMFSATNLKFWSGVYDTFATISSTTFTKMSAGRSSPSTNSSSLSCCALICFCKYCGSRGDGPSEVHYYSPSYPSQTASRITYAASVAIRHRTAYILYIGTLHYASPYDYAWNFKDTPGVDGDIHEQQQSIPQKLRQQIITLQ